jgi:hypothetical protein
MAVCVEMASTFARVCQAIPGGFGEERFHCLRRFLLITGGKFCKEQLTGNRGADDCNIDLDHRPNVDGDTIVKFIF